MDRMRSILKTFLLLLVGTAFLFPPLLHAADFSANLHISGNQGNFLYTLSVTDPHYRIEKIKGPAGVPSIPTIYNRITRVTRGPSPQVRQYVEETDPVKTIMLNPLVAWEFMRKDMKATLAGEEMVAGYTKASAAPGSSHSKAKKSAMAKKPIAKASGNIIFILDASGSMWGQVEGTAKIAIAKEVLTVLIRDLPDDTVVGLVAYGHRRKGDCNDVEELITLGPLDKKKTVARIQGLSPKGKTPISRSVRLTAERIKHLEEETTIILVSDGKETCDPDPCGLVKELKSAGIKFVMHVIGFDVTEEEREQLQCMAQAGGGEYYTAGNAGEFLAAAREVVEAPTFTGGYLKITSLKKAQPFDARVDVYRRSDNKSMGGQNTWFRQKSAQYKLVPGTYYLKLTDRSVTPHQRQEIRDIEIISGQTVKKTVAF